jgi:oligosaccharide repeat unit polymerase
MIELLLVILTIGLILSFLRAETIVDPFFIYFGSWFFVFASYYVSRDTYIELPNCFLTFLIMAKLFALTLLTGGVTIFCKKIGKDLHARPIEFRSKMLNFAMVVGLGCIPAVYLKALSMSGGIDVFSVLGYIALRRAQTEDGMTYGILAYIMIMTYAVSSVKFFEYIQYKKQGLMAALAIFTSLFYVYLSTGRTFALLFLTLIFTPGILVKKFTGKGILIIAVLVFSLFSLITLMTAKGVSIESDLVENLTSLTENLRSYIVAPILAFAKFFHNFESFEYGQNVFRTLIALIFVLGLADQKPIELIKEYEFVPDPTNVYSVYEVYFRDFGLVGMFMPPLFLVGHFWLYKKSIELRGRWVFLYSVSLYPLLMQFFQDQYFSLISMLIQLVFWYMIFVKSDSKFFKSKLQRN